MLGSAPDEVLGIYQDRLLLVRKRRSRLVVSAAGENGGQDVLRKIGFRGPTLDLPWNEVVKLELGKPIRRGVRFLQNAAMGRELRITPRHGIPRTVFLPGEESIGVTKALSSIQGLQLQQDLQLHRLRPAPRISPLSLLGFLPGFVLAWLLFGLPRIFLRPFPTRAAVATVLGLSTAWLAAAFLTKLTIRVREYYDVMPEPEQRPAHRRSRRKAPRNRPVLSGFLKAFGFILLALSLASALSLTRQMWFTSMGAGPQPDMLAPTPRLNHPLLLFLAYIASAYIIYLGYRLGIRATTSEFETTAAAPIVYLRPFDDDLRRPFVIHPSRSHRDLTLNPTGMFASYLGLGSLPSGMTGNLLEGIPEISWVTDKKQGGLLR